MIVTPKSFHTYTNRSNHQHQHQTATQRQGKEEEEEEEYRSSDDVIPRPPPQPPMPMTTVSVIGQLQPMSQNNSNNIPLQRAFTTNTVSSLDTFHHDTGKMPTTSRIPSLVSTVKIPTQEEEEEEQVVQEKYTSRHTSNAAAAAAVSNTHDRAIQEDTNVHDHRMPPAAAAFHSSYSVSSDTTTTNNNHGPLWNVHPETTTTVGTTAHQDRVVMCPWQQEARRLRVILKDLGLSSLLSPTVPSSSVVPPSYYSSSSSSSSSSCHFQHSSFREVDGWGHPSSSSTHNLDQEQQQQWHSLLEEYQSLQECNQNLQSQLEAQVQYHEQMHQDMLLQQAKQHGEYQEEMTVLKQELQQKRQQIVALTQGQREMEGIVQDLEHRIQLLSEEKYRKMEEMEHCKKQNQSHHERILELQMIQTKYRDDCQELQERVSDLEQERDRYETMWREEGDRVRGLEEELGRLKFKEERTDMNVCKLVREKAHLVTKLNEANARLERKRIRESHRGDDEKGDVKKVMNQEGPVEIHLQQKQRQVEQSLQQLEKMSMLRKNHVNGGDPYLPPVSEDVKDARGNDATSTYSIAKRLEANKFQAIAHVKNVADGNHTINKENNDPQTSLCSLQELDNDTLSFLEPLSLQDGLEKDDDVYEYEDEKKWNSPSLQKASRTLFDVASPYVYLQQ